LKDENIQQYCLVKPKEERALVGGGRNANGVVAVAGCSFYFAPSMSDLNYSEPE
jgi:hypothetical protein